MVAKNFMHLNIERQYVVYLIMTMLVFVLLFFAGTSPDVMKWEGDNWVKPKVEQASSHATHHDAVGGARSAPRRVSRAMARSNARPPRSSPTRGRARCCRARCSRC
jgi:hypothetical protein